MSRPDRATPPEPVTFQNDNMPRTLPPEKPAHVGQHGLDRRKGLVPAVPRALEAHARKTALRARPVRKIP